MLKAVLWDMDGTLIDSEPNALSALRRALETEGIVSDASLLNSFIGVSADDIYHILVRDHGLRVDATTWEKTKHTNYLELLPDVSAFPEALELWWELHARGVPQAIVTNSDRIITDANLRHIGLSLPGLRTITRNDVVCGKPNPEPYLRAGQLLGLTPSNCLVIEDSASGLAAGLAAGMKTALVPHSGIEASGQAQKLKSYGEVLKILGKTRPEPRRLVSPKTPRRRP
jgi:HAD superfamily hydrolase (TIGR01509 family)